MRQLTVANVRYGSLAAAAAEIGGVRFSDRPFGVKRFQTIHHYSVHVARGLVQARDFATVVSY